MSTRSRVADLVNLSMVEEIESVSGGTLLLTLNGVEEKIPVSRRRRDGHVRVCRGSSIPAIDFLDGRHPKTPFCR